MRIVILRGGTASRRSGRSGAHSTRERGVMALGDGSGHWVLLNMSPGVAHQLDSDLRLDRHPGLPEPDVRAVVLTDAQVDHVGGLLSLRDGAPIDLYATPAVFEQLTSALPVLPVLQHYCGVHWHVVPVAGDRPVASFRVDGMPTLEFTAVATQGAPLPHLARGDSPQVGDSIALAVRDLTTGQRVFCAPGLSQIGAAEFEWMREADCLLLDTLLLDRPLPDDLRPGTPDLGSDGQCGSAESRLWLGLLCDLPARHKVLFGGACEGPDRPAWVAPGVTLACDGMEIEL